MSRSRRLEGAPSDDLPPSIPADGLIDVRAFARVLRRRWRMITAFIAAGMLLALIALLVIPSRYTSTVTLVVDPRQQRVLQTDAVLPGIGNDMGAVESQVEIVQSTTLARRVIALLHLDKDPEFVSDSMVSRLLGAVKAAFGGGPQDPMQSLLSAFAQRMLVTRRGNTYVLEISFTSKDPEKAARIANAIADDYMAGQIKVKFDATSKASAWLNERLATLRREADAAGRAVAAYKAEHNLIDTGQQRTLIEQQLTDLTLQLTQARVYASDVEARYQQMRKVSATSAATGALPEALQSQVILALRTQYTQAARTLAEVDQTLGPRHPSYKGADAELATIRAQIGRELARIVGGLHNQLGAARGRESALEKSMADLRAAAAQKDEASVRLKELEAEAVAARTVLDQFLRRYKETAEQKDLQVPDARIVSPATPPLRPSFPNALIVLGLSFVAAVLLGIGAAFWAERRKTPAQASWTPTLASSAPPLPVIAVIPEVTERDLPRRTHRSPQGAVDPDMMRQFAVIRPLSLFGEAIRSLIACVRAAAGDVLRVVFVTGGVRGEGASVVAENLAHGLALEGARTLLIDVDVDRAHVRSLDQPPGLMQVLADGVPPLRLIRSVEPSGLHVLPVGYFDDPAAAARMLSAPDSLLDDVIRELRKTFDFIILDGVPMLGSDDGRYLLESADAALLVLSWASSDRRAVAETMGAAGVEAGKFLGVAVNAVHPRAYADERLDQHSLVA